MNKIIVIVGPTASGKTKLSIELAHKYDAVIINADSTQIYKEPLIATAKIKEEEKEGIEHYLFDIVSLNENYTLYDYQKDGRKLINKLINENKNIIIVGGSGLYIKALLYDYNLEENENIKIDFSDYSNYELKKLADSINANNNIHINNRQRLERYVTYYKQTGKIIEKTDNRNNRIYNFIMIGLNAERNLLYEKINDRVDRMFENGLIIEAKKLYNMNLKNFSNIIGYKELKMYFEEKISLEDAKELIKRNSRRYAKRQYTWFNNQMKDIKWFDVDYNNFDKTIFNLCLFINKIEE